MSNSHGLMDLLSLTQDYSYTTDLDPTGALALVGTVSPRQGAFLRDFLYRYLTCQTLLGVEIPVFSLGPSGI